jgi:AcrR family transcriptional regulator
MVESTGRRGRKPGSGPGAADSDQESLTLQELPPGLELLWGRRERGRTGPKPSLTIEKIVQTAISIADAEGLAAVSMARLARELGFTTMSLYRYVRSKDELHLLMWNSSAVDLPRISGDGWRELLTDWAEQQRRGLMSRSWLLEISIGAPPAGPLALAWLEQAIAALADTPLTETDKINIVGMVSMYTLGDARISHLASVEAAMSGMPEADYAAVLRTVTTEAEHPALHRLAWSVEMTQRPDPGELPDDVDMNLLGWRFGLDCILDGVEKLVERRSAES